MQTPKNFWSLWFGASTSKLLNHHIKSKFKFARHALIADCKLETSPQQFIMLTQTSDIAMTRIHNSVSQVHFPRKIKIKDYFFLRYFSMKVHVKDFFWGKKNPSWRRKAVL